MKLIIQIPCYNEEETLPTTLAELPQNVDGVACVEVLVVDDGSCDQTAAVAARLGVKHVVCLGKHQGLGAAFRAGLDAGLRRGADIIVNTDGDNQYCGRDIPALVKPILADEADLVVGVRDIDGIVHFSTLKKWLQKLGSWTVRKAAHSQIEDVSSGFRAFNREAALRMNVFSEFSYTLETLIQAGQIPLRIKTVPIHVNPQLRGSRLAESMWHYLRRSASTVLRIYATYNPRRVFFSGGVLSCLAGLIISLRYLYLYLATAAGGHIQSLILSAILMILGFQLLVVGIVSELISVNRRLTEDVLYRLRKMELREVAGSAEKARACGTETVPASRQHQP